VITKQLGEHLVPKKMRENGDMVHRSKRAVEVASRNAGAIIT